MAKEAKTLDDLFHDTLKDIYYAEKKILATLPKMAKAAQSEELRAAFESTKLRRKSRSDASSRCLRLSTRSPRLRRATPSSVSPKKVRRS
jgi:ferritin-like metal-binding protein YciE